MNERYVRGSYPELLNSRRPRLVSVESRGVDITPTERIDRWDEKRMADRINQIAPPLDYDPQWVGVKNEWNEPRRRRFDMLDWAIAVLILALVFAGTVAIYVLATDPIGAGRFVSGGECRYPEYCQIASR